jgi:trehalose/maltose transport system substrate-binding protein
MNTKLLSSLFLAVLLSGTAGAALAERLTISCGRFPAEHALCREASERWAEARGHEVRVLAAPALAEERLAVYRELLAVEARRLDVLEIDIVWPGMLAEHLIDLRPYLEQQEEQAFFPSLIANNSIHGRLVALPWFMDLGLLFYRRDLLEAAGLDVPRTWRQLGDAAVIIQDGKRANGDSRFWGFVWQGWRYEGLTCNAMEWLASWGGGSVVEPDGRVSVDNPHARFALQRVGDWIDIISPSAVLTQTERESLRQFAAGNAAFMRNWPYAWAELSADDSSVRGKVGVALLPKGGVRGVHPATLGGWQLAVSKHSEHPELAADLVRYLTGSEIQRERALRGGYIPSRPALAAEPALRELHPYLALIDREDLALVARPSSVAGARYETLSELFQVTVQDILAGSADAETALSALADDLQRLGHDRRAR